MEKTTKSLVVVESPTKAKTLQRYLGPQYQVLATFGHIYDLKRKGGAVEPDHNFAMHYELVKKNIARINALVDAAKEASTLYLATDPDREGEAISYHVFELLQEHKLTENKPIHRVVFHEITKHAIEEAFNHPRELGMDLIQAQQARRALDYLVGFNLSPLLWRKVRPGLSAGRVQSPALRLIVEREEEIERFVRQEYWSIHASVQQRAKAPTFKTKLVLYKGKKVEQFTFTTETESNDVINTIKNQANGQLTVADTQEKQRKRSPFAPFTTSTLQQEAVKRLGFTAQKTMQVAQQLYEGIDVGQGPVGLITYMRTDSVTIAQEAMHEIRDFIKDQYGKESLPDKPNVYKTKSKNAQEAHEAVRPTSVLRTPQQVKQALSAEQFKLYDLIWKRTVASQMMNALYAVLTVDFSAPGEHLFRVSGATLISPGFLQLYKDIDEDKNPNDDSDDTEIRLPKLTKGEVVKIVDLFGEQHFTEPPARFSEAMLIKALEEFGIGRPSTYATIIATLKNRGYVIIQQKRFHPTDVGRIVNRFLTGHFSQYVDYEFTARLEDELDAVSRGEKKWIPVLKEFWQPFSEQVSTIGETVKRKDVTQELISELCPTCQGQLVIRLGKRGRFVGCTNYPECNYTRNMDGNAPEEKEEAEVVTDRTCPKCQSSLVIKKGKYGKFIGCSNYPTCRHIEPLEKPADTGVACPECKKGTLVGRKSRYGKLFYSCNTYPTCKYATWNEPVNESCPQCKWPILTLKITKRRGTEKVCPQKECGFTTQASPPETA